MSTIDLPAELGTAPTLTELDARHAAAVAALEAIGADRLIAERAICYVQRARELRATWDVPAPMPEYDERNTVERLSGGTIGTL